MTMHVNQKALPSTTLMLEMKQAKISNQVSALLVLHG